jgi:hypothetical protein
MRAVVFCLAAVLSFASAPSHAQLKGENLLVALPQGFKVGFQDSRNGMNMQEWVPANETVQNWTEMVTVQVFLKRSDLDPVQFLATMAQQWAGRLQGQHGDAGGHGQGQRLCLGDDAAAMSPACLVRQARDDDDQGDQGQRQLLRGAEGREVSAE